VKFVVTSKRKDHAVEVAESTRGFLVSIDKKQHEVDASKLPGGEVVSLLVDGRSYEATVSRNGTSCRVTIHGNTYDLLVRDELSARITGKSACRDETEIEKITAPMPGLVVEIKVEAGQTVSPGQPVVVVEAMKMQNELSCRSAGTVIQIHVSERQTVSSGQILLSIDPSRKKT